MIKLILMTLMILLFASGVANSLENRHRLLDIDSASLLKIKFDISDLYISTNDLFMEKYNNPKNIITLKPAKEHSYVSDEFVQFVGVFVSDYKSPKNLKLKIKFSNYKPDSGSLNIKFNF